MEIYVIIFAIRVPISAVFLAVAGGRQGGDWLGSAPRAPG